MSEQELNITAEETTGEHLEAHPVGNISYQSNSMANNKYDYGIASDATAVEDCFKKFLRGLEQSFFI